MFKPTQVLAFATAAFAMVACPSPIHAQCNNWTYGSTITETCGSVGIGASSPARKLDVVDGSSAFQMRFSTGANEGGIGADGNGFFRVVGTIGGAFGIGSASQGTFTEVMRIINNGYVGIGTTNPQQLLDVAGTMAAREIIVSTTGADYVFGPDYRLPSLTEVAAYIADHHHLPDIPSAAEMKEKGVGVADMQAKLLAKIEELTLHMIEAEKEIHELRERIARPEAVASGKAGQ